MNILTPQPSNFGRPDVFRKKNQKQPAQGLGLSAHDSGPDHFFLQTPASDQVTFSGHHRDHQRVNIREQLFSQFPAAFQPVLKSAVEKAMANRDHELTAEHVVWAAIKKLDELAGWEEAPGRHSRASNRESKELAETLTQALLPNHPGITPVQAAKLLKPLADEIARSIDHNMDLDEPANLGTQRALQNALKKALNSEEADVEPAPQALFRKILWQQPPVPSFAQLAARTQAIVSGQHATPPDSASDRMSAADEESVAESTQSSQEWKAFHHSLQEKSPGLAKWVNNSSKVLKHPNYEGAQLPPLHQIVAGGIEQAERELNPTGKRRQIEPNKPQTHKNSLNALVPVTSEFPKVGRPFLSGILERHRRALTGMPAPANPQQAQEQAQRSRRVIEQFLNQPERTDYSLNAFVEYLKDEEAASDPGSPAEHAEVGQVLTNLLNDARDTRAPQMELFEKTVPTVLKYGTNMVRQGLKKQLPEVLLRRQATDSMLAILSSGNSRTNIMLNAASGEGKTFAVQGLAQRIADDDVPPALKGAQMVQLNLGALTANSSFRGELEGKVEEIFKQLNRYLADNPTKKVVLFVDEAHMLGDMMDTMKASGILERKNLSFIGATTPDDWKKSALRADQAFQGRFQELSLPSFSKQEKLALLGNNSIKMAQKHNVEIPPEVLEVTLDQATAKWPENSLRRATDLLGLAVSLATKGSVMEQASLKDQLQYKQISLENLKHQKDLKGRFVRQMAETEEEIESLNRQIQDMEKEGKPEHPKLTDKHVRQAMAILTGERIGTLSQNEQDKIHHAKEIMGRSIIGQDEALEAAQKCLRKIAVHQQAGGTRKRPIASMLLCGPTGVGKTELSEVIAREFMNNNYLRLDMSEYSKDHEVSKLLGSPPGYVGHENGGLIDQIRKTPNMVLVFDEIEKADEKIYDILLPILDKGEVRDNHGQVVSFRDAIVILTSNLNNEQITKQITKMRHDPARRGDSTLAERELERQIKSLLTKTEGTGKGFKPEQLERFDAIIPFSPLSKGSVSKILDIRLREMNEAPRLKNNNLNVALSPAARDRLIELASAGSTQEKPTFHFQSIPAHPEKPKNDDDALLPGGARSVGKTFERFISDTVFEDLAFEPKLADIANAKLIVDYDTKTQSFQVQPRSMMLPHRSSSSMMDYAPTGKTLAFA